MMRPFVLLVMVFVTGCTGLSPWSSADPTTTKGQPTSPLPYFTSSAVGVGVQLTLQGDTLTVFDLIENTAAFDSGLNRHDQIVAIDGESTKGMTLKQAWQKLGGRPGTKANLTVRREGTQTFSITRQTFHSQEAFWETATPESVRAEIARGADPNARDKNDLTPLHWAAAYTAIPANITELVVAGADPNAQTKDRSRPGPFMILLLQMLAGTDLNVYAQDGSTPLHWAAAWNTSPAIITALVAAGADPNTQSGYHGTPLHVAATWNNTTPVANITELVEAGADPNAGDDYWSETPLHRAVGQNATLAIITALVEAGADPNARDFYNATPLHRAAEWNATPAIITALLEAGAGPWVRTNDGKTPLEYARGRPAVYQALARAMTNPPPSTKGSLAP